MTREEQDMMFMRAALAEAELAGQRGEVPVGAVLVREGEILAAAGNTRENAGDALGHAELEVIRLGCKLLGGWRLTGCTLYVTLEPCPMCAGACINARVDRVVYGAADPVAGVLGSRANLFAMDFPHRPTLTVGVLGRECGHLLREFFAGKRTDGEENIHGHTEG